MLFAGEDGDKYVKILSGGEKVRCLFSKMMIQAANVLIFDEPTNHLDMESITALNNGMIKFQGVELFSSRDHQIVETTANRIMEILPNGKMIDKITTYDEYLASDEMARRGRSTHQRLMMKINLLFLSYEKNKNNVEMPMGKWTHCLKYDNISTKF